jgi:hypothetical protein
MTGLQLKYSFHKLIEDFSNEKLLAKFYNIMSSANATQHGEFWNSLSEEQKAELIDIDLETDNEANLISYEDIKKKYAKWFDEV